MEIAGRTALVVGANGGIGRAYVQALLERGAARIYAGDIVSDAIDARADERVTVLTLDVTEDAGVATVASRIDRLDLLVNCAGVLAIADAISADLQDVERELQVNYLGPLRVTRAFLPQLRESRGAVVNMCSIASLASMPSVAGYSSSKAAVWSLTQALRARLTPLGISVHGVYPGPVDTPMTKDLPELEGAKADPLDVARTVLDAVETGEEDVFPDPMARSVAEIWRSDPKELERHFSAF
jgi:NAD(P)-dependent dehydrogenase (short-subunit alcohol dehydrogenase family)